MSLAQPRNPPIHLTASLAPMLCYGLLTLVSACGRAEPIRIGVVVGTDGIMGARLAADSINRAGGVNGRTFELVLLEGQWLTSADAALRAADSLARRRDVLAVVGHANSSASLAASQVYNAQRVVQIAPNSTAPLYSNAGPYSFRMVAGDAGQSEALVAELVRRGAQRTAVFYVNDDYGRGLYDNVVRKADSARLPLIAAIPYIESEKFADIRRIVHRMQELRPDALLWLGRAPDLRIFLENASHVVTHDRVVASDGVGAVCCHTQPARQNFIGVTYARLVDPGNDRATLVDLRRAFVARYEEALTDQAALTYDAVLLLARAIQEAGPDREAIRAWLSEVGRASNPFEGAASRVVFDEEGDARTPYFLDTVRPR